MKSFLSERTIAKIKEAPTEVQKQIIDAVNATLRKPIAILTCYQCDWGTTLRGLDSFSRAKEWLELHQNKYHDGKDRHNE